MLRTVCQRRFLSLSAHYAQQIRAYHRTPQRLLSRTARTVSENPENANYALEHLGQSIRPHLPSIAQKMLDDRLLHKLKSDSSSENRQIILRSYLDQCRSAEERHETVVSFSLLQNHQRLFEHSCENCLYSKTKCICRFIQKSSPYHKLWVFQHHCEYGRQNNTGSLLCVIAEANRTIRGLREQEQQLLKHVGERPQSAVVLFPADHALTVHEYKSQRASNIGPEAEDEPLSLILLDGTSRQAKNLDRFMPSWIPRVRIAKGSVKSWLDPIRKQTEEHRVCTAQAAAMILHELGDVKTSEVIESAVRKVVHISCSRRVQHFSNDRERHLMVDQSPPVS